MRFFPSLFPSRSGNTYGNDNTPNGYGHSRSGNAKLNSYTPGGGTLTNSRVEVSGGGGSRLSKTNRALGRPKLDNASDEYIMLEESRLGSGGSPGMGLGGGLKKTMSIEVTYENASEDGSGQRTMDRGL